MLCVSCISLQSTYISDFIFMHKVCVITNTRNNCFTSAFRVNVEVHHLNSVPNSTGFTISEVKGKYEAGAFVFLISFVLIIALIFN